MNPINNLDLFNILKGVIDLATIYTTLIVKGYKTFSEVPEILQEEVRNQLIALELGHLAQ